MKFFTVPGDRLKEFAKEAKARGILYVVIKDKVNPDQTEVMVFADDAAKMNRVLDRMNLDFVKAGGSRMTTSNCSPLFSSSGRRSKTSAHKNSTLSST